MKKILLVVSLGLALDTYVNKGTINRDTQVTQSWNMEKLYTKTQGKLDNNNYTQAVKLYRILESRFPNDRYAQQSQLDTVYTYYKDGEPEKALAAIARFQRHHPQHPNMDYALYLKGLVLFNENQSFLNKLASQDWSDHDPKTNRGAYQAFAKLVRRYPNSKYVADTTERMAKLVDALSDNEMSVTRYYMKRGACVAAANYAQKIVSRCRNTRYVEEASAMMGLAYKKLSKPQLAADTHRVLETNFPQNPFLQHEQRSDDVSWWRCWR